MLNESLSPSASTRGHRVRELVCAYRPLRDSDGRVVDVPAVALNTPRNAAAVLAPLIADQPVEVFGVACLSTQHRLLAWHLLSRGTRASTPVSMPDVFLPACLTPGTTGLMVVHNHPSGDPTPSPDDARLTLRLCAAADVLDIALLDHLIVGDERPVLQLPRRPARSRRGATERNTCRRFELRILWKCSAASRLRSLRSPLARP